MRRNLTLLILFIFTVPPVIAQKPNIIGKITDASLSPLPFASIEVKGLNKGVVSREDGGYQLYLEEGKYDLIVSMIGYKTLVTTIFVGRSAVEKNVILEEDKSQKLDEVVIKGKDMAAEIIRKVIQYKEPKLQEAGDYSCNIYIKAVQYDSSGRNNNPKVKDTINPEAYLKSMEFAEIALRFDYEFPNRTKEEQIGITKSDHVGNLFFLNTMDGDFNFYHNLLKVPAVSEVPLLSPVSYSGLMAYKFKMMTVERVNGRKNYTISVKPRLLSNATVEGEITIEDSTWAILHTRFSFPRYHLPRYDFFSVEQNYEMVDNKAWLVTYQRFVYHTKSGKNFWPGQTIVQYKDFELNKTFPKKYFGDELGFTGLSAYNQDSAFWQSVRTEPLTETELRFIRYKDSVYTATHSVAYLDSMDNITNRFTLKKIFLTGMALSDHTKGRKWYLPPVTSVFRPLQFGGSRLALGFSYNKIYPTKKSVFIWNEMSYGIRNHDVNGSLRFTKLYDPFHRSYYRLTVERDFQFIFQGDAWINMVKRSNIYLNNGIGAGHNLEILNGLFLFTDMNVALRRSVSDYKINSKVDSLFGDVLEDNSPVDFQSYNATYGEVKIQYTPHQKYLREPREKVILGSSWPTFYVSWRKGIPELFGSKVNFDYMEWGMEQEIRAGLFGLMHYSIRTGSFLSRKDLRMVDYKFQRRGDPLLFLNPDEAFQALDSTFATFHRYYEGHLVHHFNGAVLNKVPFLKKIGLGEVAGAGMLIAPERNLRYVEGFMGVEKVLKWPFDPRNKVKLGIYVVGSTSNQFRNPVQFKIGFTTWDKVKNKWY